MLTFDNEGNLVCTYQNFAEGGDKPLFKKGLGGVMQRIGGKAQRLVRKGKKVGKVAWGATKKGAGYALKGVNTGKKSDYAINAGIRAGEGALVGGGTGAILGNLHGRSKRNKLGAAARAEASKGLKNKFLNAIFKNRLSNAEKAARSKVSLAKETLKGAGIGAGAGAATGAAAGAAETFFKHGGASKLKNLFKSRKQRAKEANDEAYEEERLQEIRDHQMSEKRAH